MRVPKQRPTLACFISPSTHSCCTTGNILIAKVTGSAQLCHFSLLVKEIKMAFSAETLVVLEAH